MISHEQQSQSIRFQSMCAARFGSAGFSLVEVVIAIGILSFAMVPLLGMLPTGLNTFRNSIDRSVSTQIAQQILNEARQTDFTNLSSLQGNRYFTEEGDPTTETSPNRIYLARTDIITQVAVPGDGTPFSNASLAKVRVQVANSPVGKSEVATIAGPAVHDFTGYIPKM
jgi:uncharacterized protein (TIGR02598 family)